MKQNYGFVDQFRSQHWAVKIILVLITSVLLSPFDNLLWDRPFARRVLGFDHLIEVYKKEDERRYGYYVLPFLWRDRIVGRADLQSERDGGRLVGKAFHREPGRPDPGCAGGPGPFGIASLGDHCRALVAQLPDQLRADPVGAARNQRGLSTNLAHCC